MWGRRAATSTPTAIHAGTAIDAAGGFSFDKDPDGKVRGSDGKWDVGAFEH